MKKILEKNLKQDWLLKGGFVNYSYLRTSLSVSDTALELNFLKFFFKLISSFLQRLKNLILKIKNFCA
jgi:hypothetical protein